MTTDRMGYLAREGGVVRMFDAEFMERVQLATDLTCDGQVHVIHCDQSGCRSSSPFPGPESVAQRLAAGEGWTGVVGDRAACPECGRQQ